MQVVAVTLAVEISDTYRWQLQGSDRCDRLSPTIPCAYELLPAF